MHIENVQYEDYYTEQNGNVQAICFAASYITAIADFVTTPRAPSDRAESVVSLFSGLARSACDPVKATAMH